MQKKKLNYLQNQYRTGVEIDYDDIKFDEKIQQNIILAEQKRDI